MNDFTSAAILLWHSKYKNLNTCQVTTALSLILLITIVISVIQFITAISTIIFIYCYDFSFIPMISVTFFKITHLHYMSLNIHIFK